MTKVSKPIKSYKAASHTVTPSRQIVMLYDGTIRFLQQAKEAMEAGAIEQRYVKLLKASEIIVGLRSCLDFESAAEAARILYDFYSSIDMRIFALHQSNDAAACSQIIDELREMREAWDKVDRGIDFAAPTTKEENAAAVISSVKVSV